MYISNTNSKFVSIFRLPITFLHLLYFACFVGNVIACDTQKLHYLLN